MLKNICNSVFLIFVFLTVYVYLLKPNCSRDKTIEYEEVKLCCYWDFGIRKIGIGYNLERDDAEKVMKEYTGMDLANVIRNCGNNDNWCLSELQARLIFRDITYDEAEKCVQRIGGFPQLIKKALMDMVVDFGCEAISSSGDDYVKRTVNAIKSGFYESAAQSYRFSSFCRRDLDRCHDNMACMLKYGCGNLDDIKKCRVNFGGIRPCCLVSSDDATITSSCCMPGSVCVVSGCCSDSHPVGCGQRCCKNTYFCCGSTNSNRRCCPNGWSCDHSVNCYRIPNPRKEDMVIWEEKEKVVSLNSYDNDYASSIMKEYAFVEEEKNEEEEKYDEF